VEPESAGHLSELAKTHPEWLATYKGGERGRLLDLTNPEVEKWVEKALFDIIRRYKIDLLRLDFNNRSVTGTRENGRFEENILWRYTEALYRIFDHIHQEFPTLLLENCAGGGGRTDLGMMKRFSKTQFTDWYRLPRGAKTLNGMSLCLPPECLLIQYGSALDNNNTGSAEMQIQMMILGVPKISGIAPIQEEVNPAMWGLLKRYLLIYRDFIRPIQRKALIYHHTPVLKGTDGKGWMVLEYATPEKDMAYLFAARLPDAGEEYLLKPRGLSRSKTYRVTLCSEDESFILKGEVLVQNGLTIRKETPLTSELVLIRENTDKGV